MQLLLLLVASAASAAASRGLDDDGVRRAATAALEHGGRAGVELDLVFVDDATLADIERAVTEMTY